MEASQPWLYKFESLNISWHRLVLGEDSLPKYAEQYWSVVFVDSAPAARRADYAALFKDTADFIVIHDYSDISLMAALEPLLHHWRYQKVAQFSPTTIVLSNTKEIPF